MKPQTGMLLRLLGPLIEITCAAILVRVWGEGRTIGGVAVEPLLMFGFAVGLAMVIAGLTLVKKPSTLRRPHNDQHLL